ncbi:predicted protein [Sclerotinia sclerotiorum 1980 UF-70]|uniref:RING-type domain-containing protein n=2 Tax=Sclerotinia sclerotiorum (strain ATCC 18683 / 1980 / Ss-1) TaxID=665079 RepID=A7EHW3_SCLS1|nr:predicted protein [Sclerotinia sclerotiorum 1980 UF-70]APA11498.1 hypothetical protein sscle_08g062680 [Sclerotinia sclerotiorum 1980 UF-70]EDO02429.1 predicted protein [Sclerotinia sclerotiorum 1980 UF-70]
MAPKLTRVSVASIPVDQRTCSICQDTIGGSEGGEPVKTECNHYFDRNCIEHWLDGDKTTCPVCRKEIRNTGGGGLRDRLRNINRGARLARERAIEEREQMQQAQADYGGANDYPISNASASDDEHPTWVEYEPMPPSSPGNFNTPRPPRRNDPPPRRNHSPPRQRYQESRPSTLDVDLERAVRNYTSTLNFIQRADQNIMTQAKRSNYANERHHAAERRIQAAFTQLQVSAESRDVYAIEHALALQDSATSLLNDAYAVLEREGSHLAEMIEQRQVGDERLMRAREEFARVRDRYVMSVRKVLGVGRGGREGRKILRGDLGMRLEDYRNEYENEDDDEAWEPYDPAAWQ